MDKACRQCRREGQKLFLKGDKCTSPKCPFARRSYAPGAHGQFSGARLSEYGRQLREKQKAARIYGLRGGIFRNYYKKASRIKGKTDEALLQILEKRLDNAIYRCGVVPSRNMARQLVSHGHIKVNGQKVDIPSCQVKTGDKIEFKDQFKKSKMFSERKKILEKFLTPKWLKLDKKNITIEILRDPQKEEIEVPFDPAQVIEYYSR